ncbi:hypothetical protein ACFXTO_024161 [Malus domestica]
MVLALFMLPKSGAAVFPLTLRDTDNKDSKKDVDWLSTGEVNLHSTQGCWNSFAFIIFAILIEHLLRFEDLPLDEGVALKETCVNINSVCNPDY